MAETEKTPSLQDLNKTTPAKKAAPAKSTLTKATSAKEEKDPLFTKETRKEVESHGVTVPPAATEEDAEKSVKANDDRVDPEDEDTSDMAPGHGIISVEKHENDRDVTNADDVEVVSADALARANKMSPPGMTDLNTHSGGSETIIHDKLDVVVKPLSEAENRAHRVIEDETGKSRLLHPEVTRPTIPSEQATVQGTYQEHVYATPFDPNNDPSR